MIDIATLKAMLAAGATAEVIVAAVEADLTRAEERRTRNRDRMRSVRERARTSANVRAQPRTAPAVNLLLSSSDSQEVKKEVSKKERVRKCLLPATWQPNAKHYEKARKLGYPDSYVEEQAENMRHWADSKGIMRPGWDATFFGFLKPKHVNGYKGFAPRPGSKEDTRERTVNALRALDPFPDSNDFEGSESPDPAISGFLPFAKPS